MGSTSKVSRSPEYRNDKSPVCDLARNERTGLFRSRLAVELQQAAVELRAELESSSLVVGLVPQKVRTNEGGMRRVAISRNAKWYRDFCSGFLSSRVRRNNAADTLIKRRQVERALCRMETGEMSDTLYMTRLLPILTARAGRNSK